MENMNITKYAVFLSNIKKFQETLSKNVSKDFYRSCEDSSEEDSSEEDSSEELKLEQTRR